MNYEIIIDALTQKIKSLEEELELKQKKIDSLIIRGDTLCILVHNEEDQDELERAAEYFRNLY